MSKHDDRLADYTEVPDRIRQFFEKYPDGSLRRLGDVEFRTFAGTENGSPTQRTFIVYTAVAYRTPDDTQPGMGTAWEPFPGTTPYTRNSELQNAETSAWGRALVALGFVAKKIATAEDVRNRQNDNPPTASLAAVAPKPRSDISSAFPMAQEPPQAPQEELTGEVVHETSTIDPAFASDLFDVCTAKLSTVGQFRGMLQGAGVHDLPVDLRTKEARLAVLSGLTLEQGHQLEKALRVVPSQAAA